MVTRKRLRSIVTTLGLYVAATLLIGYFWINAHSGNRGLKANQGLLAQEAELNVELDRLKAQHAAWQHRVELLRPEGVDPDTLDERARAQLDFVHPRDLILMLKRR